MLKDIYQEGKTPYIMEAKHMKFKTLLVDTMDGVSVATLNRPEKLNAVNLEMRLEFLDLLDILTVDDELRVLIVTGAGRAFCAGADISEFQKETAGSKKERARTTDMVKQIYEFKKPIIGAINGVSAGDGSQWLLAFDINIASEHARFAWPATRLGIL
jgi:enoyl-CoA hydratase/carnithine racemase